MKRHLKKTIAFAIALISAIMLIILPTSAAYVMAYSKIEGFSDEYVLDEHYDLGQSGNQYEIKAYPGEEIRIPLTADMFTWSDDRSPLPMEAITLKELRSGKVKVRTRLRSGSTVLDYVQLNTDTFKGAKFYSPQEAKQTNKTAYISVVFTDKLISVDDVKFDFDISLTVDGKLNEDFLFSIAGDLTPYKVYADANTDAVNIADGTVIEADDYARNVKVDIGNGITITKNLIDNKRYYGTCSFVDGTFLTRENIADIYPIVHGAYELDTINMDFITPGVKIDPILDPEKPDNKVFFVYNEDMEYLGKTDETIAFSKTYILTTEEVPAFSQANYSDLLEKLPTSERATPATEGVKATASVTTKDGLTTPSAEVAESAEKASEADATVAKSETGQIIPGVKTAKTEVGTVISSVEGSSATSTPKIETGKIIPVVEASGKVSEKMKENKAFLYAEYFTSSKDLPVVKGDSGEKLD